MNTDFQIEDYLSSLPQLKQQEMRSLHQMICLLNASQRLWFLDGKDEKGKVVSNPNIGYGTVNLNYANGSSREFYKIGLSANSSGISIYIMGLSDKNILKEKFEKRLPKATVSGYCIKFKSTKNLDSTVLEEIIQFGLIG